MAKTPKQDKDLYSRLRASGVRKRAAHKLSALASTATAGGPIPRKRRESVEALAAAAEELQELVRTADRGGGAPHPPADGGHAIEVAEPGSMRVNG